MLSFDDDRFLTGDSFVKDVLSHTRVTLGDKYDPAKAHDYYMRTRQLKGRKVGSTPVTTVRPKGKALPVKIVSKKLSVQDQINARVSGIQARIAVLKKTLDSLIQQLNDRKAKAKATTTAGTATKKSMTIADKNAAAKSSAKYYDKNKTAIAAKAKAASAKAPPGPDTIAGLEKQITDVKAKIVTMRSQLAAALKQ